MLASPRITRPTDENKIAFPHSINNACSPPTLGAPTVVGGSGGGTSFNGYPTPEVAAASTISALIPGMYTGFEAAILGVTTGGATAETGAQGASGGTGGGSPFAARLWEPAAPNSFIEASTAQSPCIPLPPTPAGAVVPPLLGGVPFGAQGLWDPSNALALACTNPTPDAMHSAGLELQLQPPFFTTDPAAFIQPAPPAATTATVASAPTPHVAIPVPVPSVAQQHLTGAPASPPTSDANPTTAPCSSALSEVYQDQPLRSKPQTRSKKRKHDEENDGKRDGEQGKDVSLEADRRADGDGAPVQRKGEDEGRGSGKRGPRQVRRRASTVTRRTSTAAEVHRVEDKAEATPSVSHDQPAVPPASPYHLPSSPTPAVLSAEERRARRLVRNKESARRNRETKKAFVRSLQACHKRIKLRNKALENEAEAYMRAYQKLEQDLVRYGIVTPGGVVAAEVRQRVLQPTVSQALVGEKKATLQTMTAVGQDVEDEGRDSTPGQQGELDFLSLLKFD